MKKANCFASMFAGVVAVFLASAGQGQNANYEEVFDFRDWITEAFAEGIAEIEFEQVCSMPLPRWAEAGDVRVSFFQREGRGMELFVLSSFEVSDLSRDLWSGKGPWKPDLYASPAQFWGWVYDQNRDGWIDWVSALGGFMPVLPRTGLPESDLLEGKDGAGDDAHWRVVFTHIVDSDFDHGPDTVLIQPTADSGWVQGAMQIGHAVGGTFECLWRSDHDREDTRLCGPDGTDFVTTEEPSLRVTNLRLAATHAVFNTVASLARGCANPSGKIASMP